MKSAGKKSPVPAGWCIALFLTATIICLHFFLWFHAGGFCGDEVDVVNLSGSSSFSAMARDSFPILMPLIVKSWTAIGLAGNDLKLRLLGVLIGIGIVGALWLPSWKIRRAPPLLSLTLFGLNATAIFREDYLRAYGLGTLLIVFALFAMCFQLEKPTWKRAAIFTVAAVLSVQALFQNAVFIASIISGGWTVCWLRKDKSAAQKIFIAGMAAAISLLPYWNFIFQWTQSTAAVRPGFSFVAAIDNFNSIAAFPLSQYVWVWKLLALAVIAEGVIIFLQNFRRPIQSGGKITSAELQIFVAMVLLTAAIGYFVFLKFAALITSPWYFLPLLALGAVCFDLAICWKTLPRPFRVSVWAILIATIGISTVFGLRDLNCRFTNVDLIANRLDKEISPQDYVVVTPWYFGISFNRYYHGAAAWDTLPPVPDHSTYRFDLVQSEDDRASQPVLDRIAKTLKSGHQIWIVGLMSAPAPGKRAHTQGAQFIADHSESFGQIDLKLPDKISDYEDESLLLASGWKTNAP